MLDLSNYKTEKTGEPPSIAGLLNSESNKKLITSILEAVAPGQLTHMPRQLGSARNGNLKASEWHSLFSINFPLAFLYVFVMSDSSEERLGQYKKIIENFHCLVECTELFGPNTITQEDF
ncbi:hypothetical protein O181_001041 [Austropuccinia psidii MF-1]|uniref:Uncharacterized protein n=1 Tax=Austropuccinia psidii MF-1 TaxID=1389203 RepID=A0A9Q3B9L3_9BASI|nr:hypothetical protein [Austropuccinia psidii MF-1]